MRIVKLFICQSLFLLFVPCTSQLSGFLGTWRETDPSMWGSWFWNNDPDGKNLENGIQDPKRFPICGFKDPVMPGQRGKDKDGISQHHCTYWAEKKCNFKMGGRNVCREMERQCKKSYCNPLCLLATWGVESILKPGAKCEKWDRCNAFKKEIQSPRVHHAFNAVVTAWGCTKSMKCCPMTTGPSNFMDRADWVYKFVEQRIYGDMFPSAAIPMRSCLHDPELEDKFLKNNRNKREWNGCEECKKLVKLKLFSNGPESTKRPGTREKYGCVYSNAPSEYPHGRIQPKPKPKKASAISRMFEANLLKGNMFVFIMNFEFIIFSKKFCT